VNTQMNGNHLVPCDGVNTQMNGNHLVPNPTAAPDIYKAAE